MIKKLKAYLKSNLRLQPYLYRTRHAIKGIANSNCFSNNEKKSSKFLFIVGCGRSGNTLLRRLLMEHFDIYIPPETYVLPRQINQYCFSTFLKWPEKVDVILSILENHPEFETFGVDSLLEYKSSAKKWPADQQSFVDLIEGLYRWIGEENNATGQWVGDKTPLNTLSLGLLHWAFPKAKFIFLERDPIDVVQSYLKTGLYENANDAAVRWRKSLKSWQSFKELKPRQDLLELRYEDLVADPDAALTRVEKKFSIPKRSEKRKLDGAVLGDVDTRKHHSNVLNAPSTTSIGRGRATISPENLKSVRKILRNLPQSRGYQKV